jgi:hypothetical protein
MEAANGERVDAMGWPSRGRSILMECKASRSDFCADRRKPWRLSPATGVGTLRYYMAPAGVLSPEDMPEGWGLIAVRNGGSVRRLVKATHQQANRGAEIWLLVNAVRATKAHFAPGCFHVPLSVQATCLTDDCRELLAASALTPNRSEEP